MHYLWGSCFAYLLIYYTTGGYRNLLPSPSHWLHKLSFSLVLLFLGLISVMCLFFSLQVEVTFCFVLYTLHVQPSLWYFSIYVILFQTILDYRAIKFLEFFSLNFGWRYAFDIPSSSVIGFDGSSFELAILGHQVACSLQFCGCMTSVLWYLLSNQHRISLSLWQSVFWVQSLTHWYMSLVLETCQIDKGNSHKWRSVECMGFGKAISNVTLEPKP